VKIMGFGTASLRPVDFSTAELRVEEILYVSPEQIVGGAHDERADIFSVGAVAYELFSGRRAFDATTVPAALEAITNGRPDPKALPPTEYSPRLESIVMKALARDALQRYQTIEEMSGDIENLVCETASLFFERMLENKDNAGAAGEIADGGAEGQREDEIQKLYSVALVQAAEGRLEEALKLTKAIRALAPGDPRNDEMMSYLGEMKDRETAQALLATAVEHVALGNLQEAEASIKESLALYAHDPQAQALWRTLERVKATPPDLTELQAPPTAPVPLNGRTRAVPVASGVKTDPLANTALDRFLRALTVDPRDKRAEELKGILGALGPGARDPTSTQRDS
jgi:tetratricopeptide (TPR) repeat protein